MELSKKLQDLLQNTKYEDMSKLIEDPKQYNLTMYEFFELVDYMVEMKNKIAESDRDMYDKYVDCLNENRRLANEIERLKKKLDNISDFVSAVEDAVDILNDAMEEFRDA